MSDNNLHKIFEDTACISTAMMIDYLNGKLSEKEKNKVEVHIASCEMCRDEFEGLSLLEDKSKLSGIISELDKKIDERVNKGGKKILLFKNAYKIAAIIVILIASTWFLRIYVDSSNKDLAPMVSQSMEEKMEDELKIEEAEPVVEQEQGFVSEKQQEKKPKDINRVEVSKSISKENKRIVAVADEKTVTEDKLVYMDEDIAVDEYAASTSDRVILTEGEVLEKEKKLSTREFKKEELDDLQEEENEVVVADITSIENKKTDRNKTRGEKRRKKLFIGKKKKEADAILSNTSAIDNFDLAMTRYNNKDYKQAVELFKKSINTYSNEDEVHFYLAKSYSNLNDTEKALINYNKVIAMTESPYYEDALWNKAHLLMELNKNKSAINSLNQLKTGKGIYSKKAEKIIDSLNIISVDGDK